MKVIASANGLAAARLAFERLAQGDDTLDAVVAGVTLVEDDPAETSVGLGGLPNEQGVVELDAAVMHGPSGKAGAVAALRGIRNPSRVAQLVMRHTDHVLLVGAGALEFARAQGFAEENLLTERARKIWLYWKQTLSDKDDWLPPAGHPDPEVARFFGLDPRGRAALAAAEQSNVDPRKLHRPMGTVHVAALNDLQQISCCTSTSGLAFKIAGRVGDSCIPGAGLYVDQEVGSCGSTGRGEAALVSVVSFCAVELLRAGAAPKDAGLETLRRVARAARDPWLLDARGRPNFNLSLYLLSARGAHAGVTMRGNVKLAVCDEQGPRLEDCAPLYDDESHEC